MPDEALLQSLRISIVPESHPDYKIYTVHLGEDTFTVRKGNDLMWVDSETVKRHGAEIMDYIACYIDNNTL